MAGETIESLIDAEVEAARYQVRRDAARAPKEWRPLFAELERRLFDRKLRMRPLREQHQLATSAATRELEKKLGCEPGEYVTRRRVEAVKALLRIAGLGVWDCGKLVGFGSRAGFELAYRRLCRETPTATRARLIAAGAMIVPEPPPERDVWRQLLGAGQPPEVAAAACRSIRSRCAAAVCVDEAPSETSEERAAAAWCRLTRGESRREKRRLAAGWLETSARFELLCRAVREDGRDDRRRGVALAELALESLIPLHGVLPPEQVAQLEARGWAELGNAHLLARDHQAAEAALAAAEARLARWPAPPRLRAEVWYIESFLRRVQGRCDQALELARRALGLAGPGGRLGVEILISEGLALRELGRLIEAATAFGAAFESLLALDEPYLTWATAHNLAKTHRLLGEIAAARAWLARSEPAVRALGRREPLCYFYWHLGLLTWAQGRLEQAEPHLRRAHAAYEQANDVAHGAVVGLDLALLYQHLGRPAEARHLATEVLPQLRCIGLDAEGLVALNLLQQALEAEVLEAAVLEKARVFAGRAVNAPER